MRENLLRVWLWEVSTPEYDIQIQIQLQLQIQAGRAYSQLFT